MYQKVRKAVIPAAGLGTRVLPITKSMPKEMLPIVDKPAIQYIVEEAVRSGITDILIITNRGKEILEDHFDHSIELEERLAQSGKTDMLRPGTRKFRLWPTSTSSAKRRRGDWVTRSAGPGLL